MRCILTSASLGSGPTAEDGGKSVRRGADRQGQKGGFTIIRGTKEARPKPVPGHRKKRLRSPPSIPPYSPALTRLQSNRHWFRLQPHSAGPRRMANGAVRR